MTTKHLKAGLAILENTLLALMSFRKSSFWELIKIKSKGSEDLYPRCHDYTNLGTS